MSQKQQLLSLGTRTKIATQTGVNLMLLGEARPAGRADGEQKRKAVIAGAIQTPGQAHPHPTKQVQT